MRNRIITIITALACILPAGAALTAQQVMQKVSDALTKPASTTVTFTVKSGSNTGRGTMTMCKRRFNLTSGGMSVWFDGTTQWALNRSAGEVSVTTPTPDELIESNPFVILSEYRRLYDCKLVGAPKGQYKVVLTPKAKGASMKSATLTVRASDMKPVTIDAVTSSGQKLAVKVVSVSHGAALPASYFTFDKARHKGVEVVNLR